MLLDLRAEVPTGLDFILLDARAGLHELGGLAVTELAHAAVVLGTQSAQSWAGLELVIRRLARPDEEQGIPVLLVHAMAPPAGQPGGDLERHQFREQAYDIFSVRYYRQGDIPDIRDSDQPHMPLVIPWQPELRGDLSLVIESRGLEQVRGSVTQLTAGPYRELAERLCLLFGRHLQSEAVP